MNTTTAISAIANGAPIKIVGSMTRTKSAFYLIANPSIQSIADLKGKNIGIFMSGTGFELVVREILKQNGLDPDKDVTLVANGNAWANVSASLDAKQVDASIAVEPLVSLGEKSGKYKILAASKDYVPSFQTGVEVASDKFIAEHPELLRQLLKLYYENNQYAKDNPDGYTDFVADKLRLDRDVVAAALTRETPIWDNTPALNLQYLNDTQDLQIANGFQKEKYDLSKFVDDRFLPNK
ncbi:MAG TPA: ABC transporter substrate-binding protein [Syntrophomonas sp.]|nr:ABC transporter substrate-binding protein [Syntrophomonas sp.]